MPGFDDAGTGFDDPIAFDSGGDTDPVGPTPGPVFPTVGWGDISLNIEVAFVVHEFIIGEGIIGTTPLGPQPEWTDITNHCRSWSSKRGRSRELERTQTGTLSVDLINTDGRFDPTNLTGPYTADGATQVVPGCPVRIRVELDGTVYPVWYGYADAWPGTWEKGRADTAPAFASLEASGIFEWPAGAELPAGASQGQGELSGARINRILDAVNWPSNVRDIDTGVTTMQATSLEGSIVDLMQATAESDGGLVYEGADGSVVFLDRNSPFTLSRSTTSQATFGDHLGTELPYYDVTLDYSKDSVKNDVILGRQDSDVRVRLRDGESRRKYGPKSYENTSLQNADDAQLIPLGVTILKQFSQAELRFDTITFRPQRDPDNLWPILLALELRSRITIVRRPSSGNTITRDVFVESIAHKVDPELWTIECELSSASAFATNPFIIGVSLLGGSDVLVA